MGDRNYVPGTEILHPMRDDKKILVELYRLARTSTHFIYFETVGLVSILAGALLAIYVGIEYAATGVSHSVYTVVAAFSILFGAQLLMFGGVSNLVATLNREQTRRLEEIADRPQNSGYAARFETGDRKIEETGVKNTLDSKQESGIESGTVSNDDAKDNCEDT
jgi:Mn2+/Fe2+ NRAMP family transporter